MSKRKKDKNSDDPQPLNFDHDEETGPSDYLEKPKKFPADQRGDVQETQYNQEDESISPEEVEERKKEGNM